MRTVRHSVTDAMSEGLLWERPDWWLQANCRGAGTDAFFPTGPAAGLHARRTAAHYCTTCPVAAACEAQGDMEHTGVWGGQLRQRGWRAARADAAAARRSA
jgi:hypothetical protein